MKHILPTDLVNKILSYLSSKTYSEVVNLIKEITEKAEEFSSLPSPTIPLQSPKEVECKTNGKSK